MAKKAAKYLWVEKFRPASVGDAVLPNKFKKFFTEIAAREEIPNLLLYSSTPGSGKTSIAKALCEDIDADSIYINVSSESGIDTLRSTIQQFASTKSFNKRPKVVILDEADGASHQLQAGLRAFIEEFHNHCRFILTCNYVSKIIPALREGRIMEFDFNVKDVSTAKELKPKMVKRLSMISKFENFEADQQVLTNLVEQNYPNMRKMISTMQKAVMMYGCVDDNIFKTMTVSNDLFDFIMNKQFTKAREHIIKSAYDMDELFPILYREFVPMLDKSLQAEVILILADYQAKHSVAIDSELNISACILEIIGAI